MPLTNIITLRQRSRRLSADLETPISLYLRLSHQQTTGVLPGSAEGSFMGETVRTPDQASYVRKAAMVYEGEGGGYDDVTSPGETQMMIVQHGKLTPMTLNPEDYGISACLPEELSVHPKTEAVSVLQDILTGQGEKAMMDMVTLNEGVALYLLEEHSELPVCMAKVRESGCAGTGRRALHVA